MISFSFCSIHYVKFPGAVLDPGTVVARLELDDPSRVKQVCSNQIPISFLFNSITPLSLRFLYPMHEKVK